MDSVNSSKLWESACPCSLSWCCRDETRWDKMWRDVTLPCSGFNVRCWDTQSGPRPCMADSLPTEPSSQLLNIDIIYNQKHRHIHVQPVCLSHSYQFILNLCSPNLIPKSSQGGLSPVTVFCKQLPNSPRSQLSLLVQECVPGTQEVKPEGSEVQRLPGLWSEFKASLTHLIRP